MSGGWLRKHWPDSRYIVLALSFDAQGEDKPLRWIEDGRCVVDTKTDPPTWPTTTAVRFPSPKRK